MTTVGRVPQTATRKVAYSVVLGALAVALSVISIPTGIAKLSPTQALINVLAAVLVGPWWGLAIALVTSIIRNGLGLGTVLAFPGSMIGVVLAGLLYRMTRNVLLAALGEVVGTGIIAAVVSSLLVAPYVMHKHLALAALVVPFFLSSLLGAVLAVVGLGILRRAGYVD